MHVPALLAATWCLLALAAWGSGFLASSAWRLAWRRAAWRPALERLAPLALLLPVAGAAGLAVATLAAGAHGCHCELATAAPVHLCVSHPERAAPLLIPAVALALVPAWRLLAHAAGAARRLRARRAAAARGPVAFVEAGIGNALILPLPRPLIVVDAAWWRELDRRERRIVLAHESAHVRRGDALLLEVLGGASALLPRRCAAPLLRAWRDRAERQADAAAARAVRDPLAVAALLVKLHRRGAAASIPAMGMTGGSSLEDRVRALLAARVPAVSSADLGRASVALLAGVACAPVLISAEIHAVAELVLGVLS